ncbi:MAG: FecR domain-containing protein, partial [Verrucomicrobiota bacterium]
MNETDYDRLLELAHARIERRASAEEIRELETFLESNPEARRIFTDFNHDHAVLHWDQIQEQESGSQDYEAITNLRARRFPTLWQSLAACAVISLLALVLVRPSGEFTDSFATMRLTEAARWESGTLPTAEGARLGPGTLRLTRGLATIVFDSGAEVVLEAPAELELVDLMLCVLSHGTAVAEVSQGAEGFTIHTPTANVIDHGTRFAVNVHPATGATQTQVFDGLVEVELPETGESIELRKGQRNYVKGEGLGEIREALEEATWAPTPLPRSRDSAWTVLTTGTGSGEDGYVWGGKPNDHVSDELLLLKNSRDLAGPHRKSYLRFDLGTIEPGSIERAELSLRFVPTGWGLASL